MRIYRNSISGMISIWTYNHGGKFICEQYIDYPIAHCVKDFRQKYPSKIRSLKGCKKVDYLPNAIQ